MRVAPSVTGLRILRNLAAGRPASDRTMPGAIANGSFERAMATLRRDGWIDQASNITAAGLGIIEAATLTR